MDASKNKKELLEICEKLLASLEDIQKLSRYYLNRLILSSDDEMVDEVVNPILNDVLGGSMSMFCSHGETCLKKLKGIAKIENMSVYKELLRHIEIQNDAKKEEQTNNIGQTLSQIQLDADEQNPSQIPVKDGKYYICFILNICINCVNNV